MSNATINTEAAEIAERALRKALAQLKTAWVTVHNNTSGLLTDPASQVERDIAAVIAECNCIINDIKENL